MNVFFMLVILLLVVPMTALNPLGRPAFLGYYAGVIAAWITYSFSLRVNPAPVAVLRTHRPTVES